MPPQPPAGVVIVDDDEALLASLKFALEVEGYAVRTFVSAEALLAAGLKPDDTCLVVDYGLAPGQMDGLELLDELKLRGIALPSILTTTHPSAATRRKAAAGGIAIVEKPLFGGILSDAIRRQTTRFEH